MLMAHSHAPVREGLLGPGNEAWQWLNLAGLVDCWSVGDVLKATLTIDHPHLEGIHTN